jgi:hypothetical protein
LPSRGRGRGCDDDEREPSRAGDDQHPHGLGR